MQIKVFAKQKLNVVSESVLKDFSTSFIFFFEKSQFKHEYANIVQ